MTATEFQARPNFPPRTLLAWLDVQATPMTPIVHIGSPGGVPNFMTAPPRGLSEESMTDFWRRTERGLRVDG